MTQIVLDEQLAAKLSGSHERLEFRDSVGNLIGYFDPIFTSEDIAEARRRLANASVWYTTEQVLEHLRSLDAK